jgi:hypothetical protein
MRSVVTALVFLMGLTMAMGPSNVGTTRDRTTDANPAALDRPPMGAFSTTDDIGESLWTVTLSGDYNVGCTDVQDTLMWASAGQTQLKIYVFRIDPTRTLIDSFAQTGGPSGWGIRDMAYKASTDEVFAGFDAQRFHVYNATTHVPNNTYTIAGYTGTVRGFGYDVTEDSCWTSNFTNSPMTKFSITGTNGHQVRAAANMGSAYGLARDPGNNCIWYSQAGAAGASPFVKLTYPGYTAVDSFNPAGWDLAGGCEMWRDSLMLSVEQATPDKVWCLYIGGGGAQPNIDVVLAAIDRPAATMNQGSVTPKVTIRNNGQQAASNIPVTCWVDSGATRVYNQSGSYAGTIAPGSSDTFAFSTPWNTGPAGATYNVTAFTSLAGDENRANDTAHKAVQITGAVMPGETVYVRRIALDAPNIDGVISPGEWAASIWYDFSDIAGRAGTPRPAGSVYRYFLWDGSSSVIYMACDVPPITTHGDYDQFGPYTDEDHSHTWSTDSSEGNHWVEYLGGNDSVVYRALLNTVPNVWRMPGQCPGAISASGVTSGHLQFEAQIRLGSLKGDLTVGAGDVAGYFEYMAQSPGNTFWGWFPQSLVMSNWANPTYYGHMVLDSTAPGVGEAAMTPAFALEKVAPSVVRDFARISYYVGSSANVGLGVYDATGSLVRTLQNGVMEPGQKTVIWDRTSNSGSRVSNGTYFYRLTVDGTSVSSKSVVLE